MIKLAILLSRPGSAFSSWLAPCRPVEKALLLVIQKAYQKGVSTPRVDDLVKVLGLSDIDKSKSPSKGRVQL